MKLTEFHKGMLRFDILKNKSLISGNKHIVKKLLSEIKADEI